MKAPPQGPLLKARELEVVRYMADGLTNREIAERLYLGVETVRTYAKQIYAKLNVAGRAEAGKKAEALGLLADSRAEQAAIFSEKHKLPTQLHPFIGRAEELDEIGALLARPDVRLLTILAPGGMGKTRIAVEAAAQQIGNYPDGIFFIALQRLAHHDDVVLTIADTLELKVQQDGRAPKRQLLDYLRRKQILLILDNWEHLLAGAPLAIDVLRAAPGVKILATSREKLNLSAEHVFLLRGMPFPPREDVADVLDYDAIQLLQASARRVKPEWTVTDTNLEAAVRVCRLTAGMPLGILLAASWLDVLSLDEVAAEIQKSADFLETEMRDVPDRQRSVRAVFASTWQYLKPEEQETFMKLSVFRGGFTRAAAQTITAAGIRSLQRLVEKALISQADDGRYEIHALLRQYGQAKLEETDLMGAVRDAHSNYYLGFLDARETDIKGHRQIPALDEIEADFENVRVAWTWATEKGYETLLAAAGPSLLLYCEIRTHFVEGETLFTQALAHLSDSPAREGLRSRLIIYRYRMRELPTLDETLAHALTIAKRNEDWAGVALGLSVYGRSYWIGQTEYEKALASFSRAHDHFSGLHDDFWIASMVNRIGLCQFLLGNRKEGIRLTRQSADMQRQMGDVYGLGISLNNLGAFYLQLDRYEDSVSTLRENVELGKESKHVGNLAFSYGILCLVLFAAGEFSEARELATRASTLGRDVGYVQSESLGVSGLGMLASVADEEYEAGLEIGKQASQLARNSNTALEPFAHSAIALAACGLRRVEKVQVQVYYLAARFEIHKSIFHVGLWAAIWTLYCYETGEPRKATLFLSFIANSPYETFGWARAWHPLVRIEEELRGAMDEAAFRSLWEEGSQMSVEAAVNQILHDLGE
jgi:predicted ATPase/DNA-binding CsgD family transcriptional regulator